jgi:hypothetical protein
VEKNSLDTQDRYSSTLFEAARATLFGTITLAEIIVLGSICKARLRILSCFGYFLFLKANWKKFFIVSPASLSDRKPDNPRLG